MVKMSADMENNCPKEVAKPCDLEAEKKKQAKEAKEPQTCMFDMCAMSLGPLGTMADVCANPKGVAAQLGPTTGYNMTTCVLTSFDMICGSVCKQNCKADNKAERAMFCAPKNASDAEEPVECKDDSQSSGNMEDMFNLICAKNEKGEYCQALGAAWEKKGAFGGDPTEVFPDPCAINCASVTGQAIASMGCCWGSFINAAEGNPSIMKEKELRVVKAATFKCVGMAGLAVCKGGALLATDIIPGKIGVQKCPATTIEIRRLQAKLALDFSVSSKHVTIVVCTPAGKTACEGGGRRLASSTSSLVYAVKVTGSDQSKLSAKKTAVAAKIQVEEKKSNWTAPAGPGAVTSGAAQTFVGGLAILLGLGMTWQRW